MTMLKYGILSVLAQKEGLWTLDFDDVSGLSPLTTNSQTVPERIVIHYTVTYGTSTLGTGISEHSDFNQVLTLRLIKDVSPNVSELRGDIDGKGYTLITNFETVPEGTVTLRDTDSQGRVLDSFTFEFLK